MNKLFSGVLAKVVAVVAVVVGAAVSVLVMASS